MARATMETLITRLRRLVDDELAEKYDDDTLQEFLDGRRQRANQMALTAEGTRGASSTTYLTHAAPLGNWEDGVTLHDSGYNVISADGEDLLSGRWTFNAEPDWPVFLTGWTYDLYAAAADVLEQRVAEVAELYTFSADGGQFVRSEMRAGLLATAQQYRRRQRVVTIEQRRGDVTVH